MKIGVRRFDLNLEIPFAIARGTTSVHRICAAVVEYDGMTGYGEASPSRYYGDSIEKAEETIRGAGHLMGDDPFAVEGISAKLRERFPESPSARAAIECAVYDILGKLTGQPLYKLLGLAGITPPLTSLTVGVEEVRLAERRLPFLREFPILKVKVGFGDEKALLGLLKAETGALLRLDANEGWSLPEAVEKANLYKREFGVEFVEQPLPKDNIEGYRRLRQETNLPIIVDESVKCKEDVLRWSELADGVNIKLMKCGGLREAMGMIAVARAASMKVMLGCMIESSLGITAASHIAPLVDYCDLDGNLLISNDPFVGVKASQGAFALSDEPGLGVHPSA
jgi:L-alanine-DL-glutamate epimerase-like enolase superfamily enzyme